MPLLVRLEARFLVLHDPRFMEAWSERGERLRTNLDRLREYATSRDEARLLDEATETFERYSGTVGQVQTLVGRGERTRAIALSEGASRALAERVEATLEALTESMHADVLKAQAEVARLEARTWSGVLVAFGAAVGLALLGSGLIAHRLTQSLETLSAATAAVAAGSFEEQIVVDSKDEVGELARSFNAMARELRRMEETKEEFFASVSHELRSPLTSIREGAHLLREKVSGTLTDKQRRLVEIIAAGSDRLLGLVNQILEVSRLRAGVLPIQRVRLDLDKVVTRAVEELKPTADQTGVSLEREKLGEDFWLAGDEERLLQIVVNLVGQRRPVHEAGWARRRATGVHRIGAGDPGRGHGRSGSRWASCPTSSSRTARRTRTAAGPVSASPSCAGSPRLTAAVSRSSRKKEKGVASPCFYRAHEGRTARRACCWRLLAGCATGPFASPSAQMLAKADRLAADGDYRSAIAAYDAYLAEYSDSSNAPRARASRDRPGDT